MKSSFFIPLVIFQIAIISSLFSLFLIAVQLFWLSSQPFLSPTLPLHQQKHVQHLLCNRSGDLYNGRVTSFILLFIVFLIISAFYLFFKLLFSTKLTFSKLSTMSPKFSHGILIANLEPITLCV